MKAPILTNIVLATLVVAQVSPSTQAGIHIDSTFATDIAGGPVNAISLQENGTLLVAGDFQSVNGSSRFRVAQLGADGALASTLGSLGANAPIACMVRGSGQQVFFGGRFSAFEGESASNFAVLGSNFSGPAVSGSVSCLAIDDTGRLVLGGNFQSVDGQRSIYIARMLGSGNVDPGFVPELQSSFALEAGVSSIAVQSDGKILVGGNFETSHGPECFVRLNQDGSQDAAFRGDHGDILYTKAIVPLDDGRILLAGMSRNGTGFVRRLNPDRSTDSSFNSPTFEGPIHALAVDHRGRILAGGRQLKRLKADGSIDSSWNFSISGVVNAITLDSQARILIGGLFISAEAATAAILRLVDDSALSSLSTNTNAFRASLRVEAGKDYVIESSSDLKHWSTVSAHTATSPHLEVLDGQPLLSAKRFFRARLVQ